MAEIDAFLEKIVLRGVERAELKSDIAGSVYKGGKEAIGPTVSLIQLETLIQEVRPTASQCRIISDGHFFFQYNSPFGEFQFGIQRDVKTLNVSIEPTSPPHSGTSSQIRPHQATAHQATAHSPTVGDVSTSSCARCGGKIEAESMKCPFCGKLLEAMDASHAAPQSIPKRRSKAKEITKLAGALLGLAIAGGVHFVTRTQPSYSPAPVHSQETSTGSLAGQQFPQTGFRLLTTDEIHSLSKERIQYAVNEMYARHGFLFGSDKAKQFRKFAWYMPVKGRTQQQTEQRFNNFEKSNHRLLIQARAAAQGARNGITVPSGDFNHNKLTASAPNEPHLGDTAPSEEAADVAEPSPMSCEQAKALFNDCVNNHTGDAMVDCLASMHGVPEGCPS